MLILNEGGGRGGVPWLEMGWWWGVAEWGGILKTYCCLPDLNLIPKFYYSTLLSCQLRGILSIYIPTISFHENHQPVQGWNPTTTIKITISKNEI